MPDASSQDARSASAREPEVGRATLAQTGKEAAENMSRKSPRSQETYGWAGLVIGLVERMRREMDGDTVYTK